MKMAALIMSLAVLAPIGSLPAFGKTKGKCIACVTQEQRDRVQKKLDDLRAENARLREENASRPVSSGSYGATQSVREVRTPSYKNRISALAGWGPSNLTNKRKTAKSGNQIGIESSPVVGAQYQRLLGERFSIGAQVTVPTVPDTKKPTVLGTAGYDF